MNFRISPCLLTVVALAANAQEKIPVRAIGPIRATSTESVGKQVTIRETSDGHVIVGAGSRGKIYSFDSTLQHFTIVVDSGTGPGTIPLGTSGVIAFAGDSTLMVDFAARAFQMLDPAGNRVRSIALPHASDMSYLAMPAWYGRPGLDAKGRIIYRSNIRVGFTPTPAGAGKKLDYQPVSADSAPIVRGDFETRSVDTLGWMRTPSSQRLAMERAENPSGGPSTLIMHLRLNPLLTPDQWAVLSDGTVAIVRSQDYHIDWIDPDGTKRSSAPMPVDWRRYTDAERTQRVDSVVKEANDRTAEDARGPKSPGTPNIRYDISAAPDSEFATFWPPVQPGGVIADNEGRLWILPTTSRNAANGFTYDVVDRTGKLIERVQLPKGRVLVGFGAKGAIYLIRSEGDSTLLERAEKGRS